MLISVISQRNFHIVVITVRLDCCQKYHLNPFASNPLIIVNQFFTRELVEIVSSRQNHSYLINCLKKKKTVILKIGFQINDHHPADTHNLLQVVASHQTVFF